MSRNVVAGSVVSLVGAGAMVEATRYQVGSLTAMGPGFFPMVLGGVLIFAGVLVAVGRPEEQAALGRPDWRGWAAIIAGMAAFVALGNRVGLAPASFATVFISALGDRKMTLRGAVLLAAGMTLFAVLLFGEVIQLPLPIVQGFLG